MMMLSVVAHNLSAMNANRQFGIVENKRTKSTERLSSGYKINRAADDAAGLSISEKMRRQIRGLEQGSRNCQDGISFCQIADGAMNEVADMLLRMEELSVKASNGTLTDDDRSYIQTEVSHLKDEIDHVDNNTTFNEIPVFAWDRVKTSYTTGADGSSYINGTEEYTVTGIKYGLTDVIGEDHIYNGTKLDSQLTFDSAGWHSTGEILYGQSVSTMSKGNAVWGCWSLDDVVSRISNVTGLNKDEVRDRVAQASTNAAPSIYYNNISSRYVKFTADKDGTTDLNGNKLITSMNIEIGTYDPAVGAGSETPAKRIDYFLADYSTGATGVNNGKPYGSAWIDFSGLGTDYTIEDLIGQGFNSTCATCSKHYSIYFTGEGEAYKLSGSNLSPRIDINISACTTGADIVSSIMAAVSNLDEFSGHYTEYAYNDAEPAKIYTYDSRNMWNDGYMSKFEPAARSETNQLIVSTSTIHDPITNDLVSDVKDSDGLWIQSGTEADHGFYLKRARVSTEFLGIDVLDVSNIENANMALDLVKSAVHLLNGQRAMVGAQQNRMEHTVSNIDNVVENTTAAESRIRDTDMAAEMVQYTNENILSQAGQAMLAQANQSKQGILSLLS